MLSFFPRDVLDEILNLIESVSEGFPSYSSIYESVFEKKTGLLEYPWHTEEYIVFNFATIRPSAFLSFSTSVCVSTFS